MIYFGGFSECYTRLGVGEGGGGAGEDARVRNRGMVAGGGRSTEGGDGGASGRAELVTDRWNEEEGGYDNRGPQPDKYLGVTWADRPPPQSGLSARQCVTLARQCELVIS